MTVGDLEGIPEEPVPGAGSSSSLTAMQSKALSALTAAWQPLLGDHLDGVPGGEKEETQAEVSSPTDC